MTCMHVFRPQFIQPIHVGWLAIQPRANVCNAHTQHAHKYKYTSSVVCIYCIRLPHSFTSQRDLVCVCVCWRICFAAITLFENRNRLLNIQSWSIHLFIIFIVIKYHWRVCMFSMMPHVPRVPPVIDKCTRGKKKEVDGDLAGVCMGWAGLKHL